MTSTPEQIYYENQSIWSWETFKEGREFVRLAACADMIPSDAASVLDMGAGNGAFLKVLEARGGSMKLSGLERSAMAIDSAVCDAAIVSGTLETVPFEDHSVDVVSALDVVEHLPFGVYEQALKEIQRVARKYILINVPYREQRLKAICPYCGCEFNPHYHLRTFDEEVLGRLFPEFRVREYHRIYLDESVAKVILRPFRRYVFSKFLETTICPQCSYQRQPAAQEDSQVQATFLLQSIRRVSARLPTVKVVAEIGVLYERVLP